MFPVGFLVAELGGLTLEEAVARVVALGTLQLRVLEWLAEVVPPALSGGEDFPESLPGSTPSHHTLRSRSPELAAVCQSPAHGNPRKPSGRLLVRVKVWVGYLLRDGSGLLSFIPFTLRVGVITVDAPLPSPPHLSPARPPLKCRTSLLPHCLTH